MVLVEAPVVEEKPAATTIDMVASNKPRIGRHTDSCGLGHLWLEQGHPDRWVRASGDVGAFLAFLKGPSFFKG